MHYSWIIIHREFQSYNFNHFQFNFTFDIFISRHSNLFKFSTSAKLLADAWYNPKVLLAGKNFLTRNMPVFPRKTYPFGSFEVIVIAWVHLESLLFISGRFRWSKSRGSRNTEQLTITFEQLAWTSDLFIIFNIECCFFEFSKNFKNVRKGELRTFLFHNFKIKFIII